jgi:hypothetical protein
MLSDSGVEKTGAATNLVALRTDDKSFGNKVALPAGPKPASELENKYETADLPG